LTKLHSAIRKSKPIIGKILTKSKPMRQLNRIILHCTATPEGKHFTVDQIRKWHLAQGWKDIGYHYVIYLDGTLKEGRPIEQVGAHTKDHNKDSVGIVYVGGVDAKGKAKDTMTQEQETTTVNLIKALREEYGELSLHGHNEFANKACPSFNVKTKFHWLL
jgi:N-acetylmuramoyl-L-alanine amidase